MRIIEGQTSSLGCVIDIIASTMVASLRTGSGWVQTAGCLASGHRSGSRLA